MTNAADDMKIVTGSLLRYSVSSSEYLSSLGTLSSGDNIDGDASLDTSEEARIRGKGNPLTNLRKSRRILRMELIDELGEMIECIEDLEEKTDRVEMLEEKLEKMKTDAALDRKRRDDFLRESRVAKRRVWELEEHNNKLIGDISRSRELVRQADSRVIEIKKEIENFRMESEKAMRELREENSRLRDRLEELKKENDRLKVSLEEKSRDRDALELEKNIEIKLIRGEILVKDTKISGLEREIGKLGGEVDNAVREKNTTVTALSEETKKLVTAQDQIRSRDSKISELERQVEHLKTEIKKSKVVSSPISSKNQLPIDRKFYDNLPLGMSVDIPINTRVLSTLSEYSTSQSFNTSSISTSTPTSVISTSASPPSTGSSIQVVSSPLVSTDNPLFEGWQYTLKYGGAFEEKDMDGIEKLFSYALFGRSSNLLSGPVQLWSDTALVKGYMDDDPRVVAFYRGAYAWESLKEKKRKSESSWKIKEGYPMRCMPGGNRAIKTQSRVMVVLKEFCESYDIDAVFSGDWIKFEQ